MSSRLERGVDQQLGLLCGSRGRGASPPQPLNLMAIFLCFIRLSQSLANSNTAPHVGMHAYRSVRGVLHTTLGVPINIALPLMHLFAPPGRLICKRIAPLLAPSCARIARHIIRRRSLVALRLSRSASLRKIYNKQDVLRFSNIVFVPISPK